jgi:mRNA interferase MazF
VISNSRIPFADEESIAAVVTTTSRDEAIELTDDRFERGELPRRSYVSPWTLVTLKDAMIGK